MLTLGLHREFAPRRESTPMTVTTINTSVLDREIDELHEGAVRWVALPVSAKIGLLRELKAGVHREAPRWAKAASEAKGITGTSLEGEEWISGPWAVLYALNRYIETLDRIERTGAPYVDPRRVRMRENGTVVVDVFPHGPYDSLLLNGIRAEVWMQPDVTPENLSSTMGTWYRQIEREPRVALVLGAGNITSIAPLDVLYKLLADGAVCVLKMNPVNAYLGPILEDAFAPLVREGFLRFAYGGADVGKYLCAHDGIDEIHITGSDKTHDVIVFGDGPDGAQRKARNEPVLKKPIKSELGNVSPTIVVPGPWTDADFRFQAEQIVTQKLHNDGFNCIAAQVLILPQDWDGTPKLLDRIEQVMTELRDRPAYYPGAAERRERLARGHADTLEFGGDAKNATPRTLVHTRAANAEDPMFTTEAFASILGHTTIAGDTPTYLDRAVTFANETLWGTLGGNIVVHPKTMKEHAAAVDRAIDRMEFGCVGVNAWTGVGFLLSEVPWGAYPGHTLDDIRSGIGVVHNSHFFSKSLKSIVYAPFAPFPRSVNGYGATLLPKPPWFITNTMAPHIGRALCDFEAHKTPIDATKVAALAMRG